METRARYLLIGLFSLAVIALGFGFVYWMETGGGLGQRTQLRVRYDGPVAGLLKGSAVLFNGIRVGEVTGLHLDPARPGEVIVAIAVEKRAPVRADTRAGIEFQGLSGAPVVSLTGGTPALPLLDAGDGDAPLLVAEKEAGKSMSEAARSALRRFDVLVSENAEPLKNAIASIEKFSGALARNSDRVDGVFSGIERLTGTGQKVIPNVFDLEAPREFPGLTRKPTVQLSIPEPTALGIYDSDKLLVRKAGGEKPSLDNAQWPDLLPKVIQSRLVQSFENADYLRAIGRAPDVVRGDVQLLIDVRSFHVTGEGTPVAEVVLAGRLIGGDGRILESRIFRATAPVARLEPQPAAKALSDAFSRVAAEIVVWTCSAI